MAPVRAAPHHQPTGLVEAGSSGKVSNRSDRDIHLQPGHHDQHCWPSSTTPTLPPNTTTTSTTCRSTLKKYLRAKQASMSTCSSSRREAARVMVHYGCTVVHQQRRGGVPLRRQPDCSSSGRGCTPRRSSACGGTTDALWHVIDNEQGRGASAEAAFRERRHRQRPPVRCNIPFN